MVWVWGLGLMPLGHGVSKGGAFHSSKAYAFLKGVSGMNLDYWCRVGSGRFGILRTLSTIRTTNTPSRSL